VSRFLSGERGLTLATFDALAGALGLRLIESGKGRGRPARPARVPADVPGLAEDEDMVELVPEPMEPGEETPPKLDKLDTQNASPLDAAPPPDGTADAPLPGEIGPTGTAPKLDKLDTHPGPDALHFLARSDASPDVSPVPSGTTAAATGDDAIPESVGLEVAAAPDENSTNSTPGEAGTRVDGAKRPIGDAVECPADALGHARMDDDGAPPAPAGRVPWPVAVWH
jgi:hypothetical protein